MTYNYSSNNFSVEDLAKLKSRSKAGDADSQYLLANYYEYGLMIDSKVQIKQNLKIAFKLTKLAFENGNKEALISYANYLTNEDFSENNVKLGITLYKKAIRNNDSLGAVNLARYYSRKGKYKKAFDNFLLSEKLGGYFLFDIGLCYYFGIGTKQNFEVAIKYFRSVVKNEKWCSEYEFEESNFILGKLYLEGIHLKKSILKSKFHLETANRENNHRSAQDILIMLKRTK